MQVFFSQMCDFIKGNFYTEVFQCPPPYLGFDFFRCVTRDENSLIWGPQRNLLWWGERKHKSSVN